MFVFGASSSWGAPGRIGGIEVTPNEPATVRGFGVFLAKIGLDLINIVGILERGCFAGGRAI